MKRRKIIIFAAAMLVLLAVIGTTAVLAQRANESPPDSEIVDMSQIKEDAVRALYDSTGSRVNEKRRLANIATNHEGGFGGYYFHETDKSIAYVYMQDVTKAAAAEAAFRAAYSGDREVTQIIPVRGDYSLDQLVEWYYMLYNALASRSDIETSGGSVRGTENRIYIGLRERKEQIDEALGVVEELGIPEGAVIFEQLVWQFLADKDSVTAKWRPLVGRIQHEESGKMRCTISFGTERDDVEGLVVASHCTSSNEGPGGLDNTNIHQPNDPWWGSMTVAEETIDPELTNLDDDDCPSGWSCRYSDAAFAELDSDESLDLGEIAKPKGVNETDVDPVGTTFDITAEAVSPNVGDDIYYIGIGNGWQTAEVLETCYTADIGNNVNIICVGRAKVTGASPNPSHGDSGAPVIKPTTGNNVKLLGTLFAGNNTGEFVFSRLGYIYMELGNSVTWDTCVSGC